MGVRFPRSLGPATRLSPGEWSHETASGREAWCCPCCGMVSELGAEHRVLLGGTVSPILKCEAQHCPFSDFAIFEAHAEEVLR